MADHYVRVPAAMPALSAGFLYRLRDAAMTGAGLRWLMQCGVMELSRITPGDTVRGACPGTIGLMVLPDNVSFVWTW